MYEKRDTLFQPTQSKSALKNFPIQYQIKELNGYDPESFLLNSRQPTNSKDLLSKMKETVLESLVQFERPGIRDSV